MNFFKLFIGDYQRDTGALSLAEHGAYMMMLQHYYATEAPLPVGAALYRLLRAQTKGERDAIDAVTARFWLIKDGALVNTRATIEIERSIRQRDVNRETGKRGCRPRRTDRTSETGTEHKTESVSRSVSKQEPNDNPSHSQKEQDQELPSSTDAQASPDPIWGRGLSFLIRKGIPDRSARALLGKLRKAAGDVQTAAILGQAEDQDITNPAPWLLAAAANSRAGPPKSTSRTMLAIQALETASDELTRRNTELAASRDQARPAIAVVPEPGRAAVR